MSRDDFTLDDYSRLLADSERRSPDLLPELPGIDLFHGHAGYSAVPRVRQIIAALSPVERATPARLEPERLAEVAATAGVREWEVEQLLAEFIHLRGELRRIAALNWWQRIKVVLGWSKLA